MNRNILYKKVSDKIYKPVNIPYQIKVQREKLDNMVTKYINKEITQEQLINQSVIVDKLVNELMKC